MSYSQIDSLFFSLLIFFGIFILGYLLKKIAYRYLVFISQKTKWAWDEVLLGSVGKIYYFWLFLLASHISLVFLPITDKYFALINKILLIFFILSLCLFLSRLIVNLIEIYLHQKTDLAPKVTLFEIIVKVIVFFIGFILILNILNINILPFITTLGIAGLAIGLALRDTLENFFAGIHLVLAKQIRPGDFIRLENGLEGVVEDITWRTTVIKQLQNNVIIIPNSKLAQSIIVNYHQPENNQTLIIPLTISYKHNLKEVEELILAFMNRFIKEHPLANKDFAPAVRYSGFGDSGINLNLLIQVKEPTDRFKLIHDFIMELDDYLKKHGIEIPYPIRKVYLKSDRPDKEN
jgi:Small-conductance mechanosensitive channel